MVDIQNKTNLIYVIKFIIKTTEAKKNIQFIGKQLITE